MQQPLYETVRFYQNNRRQRVQARNLTLAQAQAWCEDPETSSHTARSPRGCNGNDLRIERWSKAQKHWFDGYRKQK